MALIQILLLALSSAGYIGFIALHGHGRPTLAPFLYISFVVVFLYCFAIVGLLPLGATLCLALGLAAGAWALWQQRPYLRSRLGGLRLWHLLYIVPFVIFFFAIPSDFLFTEWDEFSFWASSIKLISQTDALYVADSATGFKHYPPGQQMFQYYLVYFAGWSEGTVLYAQIVFMLAGLLAVVGSFIRQSGVLELCAFWCAVIILYLFGFDFAHILVDQLLAVYLAASIAIAWNAKDTLRSAVAVSLTVAVLLLIKQIGLVLALVTLLIYWISLAFDDTAGTKRPTAKKLVYAALPLAALLLAKESWQWYAASIGALSDFSIPSLSALLEPPLLARTQATTSAFLERIQGGKFLGPVIGLSLLSGFTFWLHGKAVRLKGGLGLGVLFASMLGYIAFLFLSYLVFFSEYEGVRLASFSRYSKTYFLAWALVLFALASSFMHKKSTTAQRRVAIVLVVLFMAVAPRQFYADMGSVTIDPELLEKRKKAEELASIVLKHIQPGESVYFISQNSSGYEKFAFNYAMLPYRSSQACWSLGKPYGAEDVWTCDKRLGDVVDGYKYLAVYRIDEGFWLRHSLPPNQGDSLKEGGVFAINQHSGLTLSLSRVD